MLLNTHTFWFSVWFFLYFFLLISTFFFSLTSLFSLSSSFPSLSPSLPFFNLVPLLCRYRMSWSPFTPHFWNRNSIAFPFAQSSWRRHDSRKRRVYEIYFLTIKVIFSSLLFPVNLVKKLLPDKYSDLNVSSSFKWYNMLQIVIFELIVHFVVLYDRSFPHQQRKFSQLSCVNRNSLSP